MAPIDFVLRGEEKSPKPQPKFWTRSTIISFAIFGVLLVAVVGVITAFLLNKRSERKKLPAEHRKQSYHPFKAARPSSDKTRLLANEAVSPEEDKSTMYSREKTSAVSLYVDTDVENNGSSTETVSLIPLHITPAEEAHDPMSASLNNNRTTSHGSSISAISRNSNRFSTGSGMVLSPISANDEEGDLGYARKNRARSTSSASMSTRYYDRTPTDVERVPQLPKIVHTPSP